jgi:hypothetical protein
VKKNMLTPAHRLYSLRNENHRKDNGTLKRIRIEELLEQPPLVTHIKHVMRTLEQSF